MPAQVGATGDGAAHFEFFTCLDAACVDDPDLHTGIMVGQVMELTGDDGTSYGTCTIWADTGPTGCFVTGPDVGETVIGTVDTSKLPDTVELLEASIEIVVTNEPFGNDIVFHAIQTVPDDERDSLEVRVAAPDGEFGLNIPVVVTDAEGVVVFGSCSPSSGYDLNACDIGGLPVDGFVRVWMPEERVPDGLDVVGNGTIVNLTDVTPDDEVVLDVVFAEEATPIDEG